MQSAFKSTGVDVDSISKTTSVVTKTANEGVTAAKPLLSQAINFITTTEPVSAMRASRCQDSRCSRGRQLSTCSTACV